MSVVGVSVAAQQLLCLDSDLESRVLLRIEEEGGEQRCAPIVFLEALQRLRVSSVIWR
jgi:hypothetical protein